MRTRAKIYVVYLLLGASLLSLAGCSGQGVVGTLSRVAWYRFKSWARFELGSRRNFSMGNSQVKKKLRVIGQEPSWMIYDSLYTTYPFELLTDLVIGEYDVNPLNGYPRSDSARNAFMNHSIIEQAIEKNSDINILMSVTMYGDYRARPIFLTDEAIKNMVNSLDGVLEEMAIRRGTKATRDGIGVVLDFQGFPQGDNARFAQMVERINKALNDDEKQKSCLVYMVLPMQDEQRLFWNQVNVDKIYKNTDVFILRSHSFGKMKKPGPLAPYSMDSVYAVDSAMAYYENALKGIEVDKKPVDAKDFRSKTVIEVPYYGLNWTPDGKPHPERPILPISEIINIVKTDTNGAEHDTLYNTAYLKTDSSILYYEDTVSLAQKYSWIYKEKISGISLFGLGYLKGIEQIHEEAYWDIVSRYFTETPPRLLFPGIAFFLTFFVIGIIWSAISNWEVRFAFAEKKSKLWYHIALIAALLFAILICFLELRTVPVKFKIIAIIIVMLFPMGLAIKNAIKIGNRV